MVTYAVLFPGQGSQFVGMGADLFDNHPDLLGSAADEVLGWSLREMCLEGPEDELIRTEHAQPALFAVGYARWLDFKASAVPGPAMVAGHSLGEYTALCAAGAIGYGDCLRMVALRGRLMAGAADAQSSGMAALLGADEEVATSVVESNRSSGGNLQIANYNAPGQIVVAGSSDDLLWLAEHGRELGVRRSIELKVAGAFHSDFMSSAASGLKEGLDSVEFSAPVFPVWSNVTAEPHDPETIRQLLVSQVTSPVRFADSLTAMATRGADTFIHIGPGDVTAGLARKTVPDANVLTLSSPEDLPDVVGSVGTMESNEV